MVDSLLCIMWEEQITECAGAADNSAKVEITQKKIASRGNLL